jgi:ankyrin repeat protein
MGRADLHYAAGDGDVGRVRELLRGGSDPNHQDDEGLLGEVRSAARGPIAT